MLPLSHSIVEEGDVERTEKREYSGKKGKKNVYFLIVCEGT